MYKVKTNNVAPKFIDFGRGDMYSGRVHQSEVLHDIYIMLSVLCNGVKHEETKKQLSVLIHEESQKTRNTVTKVIEQLAKHQLNTMTM